MEDWHKFFYEWEMFILKIITNILHPVSEYMQRCNSNIDSELVSMCHWTVCLIKFDTFNLKNIIWTVQSDRCPCIRTVTLLNTRSKEWIEEFYSFRERFYWYGSWNNANISVLVILSKKVLFPILFMMTV